MVGVRAVLAADVTALMDADALAPMEKALKAAGVRRLIAQSSFGVEDSRHDAGLLERVFYALLLSGAYADKVLQEGRAVRQALGRPLRHAGRNRRAPGLNAVLRATT